jgi:hypothetical protein
MSGPENGAPTPQQPADAPPPLHPGFPPFQPPAPKKKRTGLIVGTSVGAVLAVAVAVSVILVSGTSSDSGTSADAAAKTPAADPAPATGFTGAQASEVASPVAAAVGTPTPGSAAARVAVPASAGGLTQMTDSAGRQRAAAMKKADAGVPDLADADFAAYTKTGSSAYFGNLTLVQLNEATDLEESYLTDGAAATLTAAGTGAAVSDPDNVNVTMPGGAMTCGSISSGSVTLRGCFWVDAAEFGILAVPSSTSDAQAAAYAEAVWSASETS